MRRDLPGRRRDVAFNEKLESPLSGYFLESIVTLQCKFFARLFS